MAREKMLVERGLSNGQAQRLSLELSGRGVGVECTLSALAGWDVWMYRTRPEEGAPTPPEASAVD